MTTTKSIVIPSDLDKLAEVDQIIEDITGKLDFSRDERDDIAISLSEAVNNAILHGNGNDPQKEVNISIAFLSNGLKIEISDQGNGFNETDIPDPTAPENVMATAGRGLLIIKHLMDNVEVQKVNKGTKVVMTKYYSREEAC